MRYSEIATAILIAIVLVAALIGGMWFLLVHGGDVGSLFSPGGGSVECTEEDGEGVCGVRRYFGEGSLDRDAPIDL